MNSQSKPSRYSPEFDMPVRGDSITADRYISKAWMAGEMKNLWPKSLAPGRVDPRAGRAGRHRPPQFRP